MGSVSQTCPVELFEGLSESASQRIPATSPPKWFAAGQEIFRAGERREAIYVLLDGLAKVSQVDCNGNEVILWLTRPGQVIGSLNFANSCTQSSSAWAVQSCSVVMWSLPAFESILEYFPAVMKNVERIIARQIVELSSRICEISTAPAWLCTGRALIRLTDQIGRRVNGHVGILQP